MNADTLYTTRELKACTLHAVDGILGTVQGFYFDDITWKVRYLLSRTGDGRDKRHVLISSMATGAIRPAEQSIDIELTRHQIENSPPLRKHQPVSRQFETDYYRYYGWPPYWEQDQLPDSPEHEIYRMAKNRQAGTVAMHPMFTHLHSTDELNGCLVTASDGVPGRLEDLILDTRYWLVKYLVVNTHQDRSQIQVLVSPGWADQINFSKRNIHIDLPSHLLRQAMPLSYRVNRKQ